MKYQLLEDETFKIIKSKGFNMLFNKKTGYTETWGKTREEDPPFSPFGPVIADIEVSTICHQNCSFCYKSNTDEGENMSLETFKKVFHKLPRTLTQIALGLGSIDANPDLYNIMAYCRDNDYNYVVPNLTINGAHLTDYHADKIASLAGACAVSHYSDNQCFNAIKKLTDRGMTQCNIHKLLCQETLESCFELMKKVNSEPRLEKLSAIVFLMLKPKGNRNTYHGLQSLADYKRLVDYALENNIRIGFDSCSAPSFLKSVKDHKDFKTFNMLAESCESDLFSIYINTEGRAFHCSFTEGEAGWQGIDVANCEDFIKDVWFAEETCKFRINLLKTAEGCNCRSCPIFNLELK